MKQVTKVLHWLNAGIFPGTLLLSCGFTYTALMGLLKAKKAHDWLAGLKPHQAFIEGSNYCYISTTVTNPKTGKSVYLYYIFIRDTFQFTDREYCNLAHECLHICQVLLPDILNRDREHEAEAYLHTHLMEQCLKALRGDT
jgi:hypothetical protein